MRIEELRHALYLRDIDVAVFISDEFDPNVFYLTGYAGAGILVVPKENEERNPSLIVLKRDGLSAKKSGLDVYFRKDSMLNDIRDFLAENGIQWRSVGLDADRVAMSCYLLLRRLKLNISSISEIMCGLRKIKTDKEISFIRESCRIADGIMNKVASHFSDFDSESDVSAFIECEIRRKGLLSPFHSIVASGKNACDPHHRASCSRICSGPVVVDFGVCFRGYCSDISRTICIGRPSDEVIAAYRAVQAAQKTAIDAIQPGVACRKLDAIARRSLGSLESLFIHGLGHGLGLEVHEAPTVNSGSDDVLEEGMVLTIEPGVYSSSFGVRLEDDVLVTKDGPELLTSSRGDLIII